MKKLIMICITAAVMMAPLAAYARPVRVIVGPGFGWGGWGWHEPYLGPLPYGCFNYRPRTGAGKFHNRGKDPEGDIDGRFSGHGRKLKNQHPPPRHCEN